MSQTDAMLLDNWLRERNADAFKVLAARYAAMVYNTCRRILKNPSEAEDVTQECFIILAATNQPVGDYLAPWLHRVAYNRSLAHLRSEQRRKDREIRFAREQAAPHDMPWNEAGAYVDEAIAGLPDKLRIPVIAYFLDGQSHEAIAQTLGISRSTVGYRVDKGVESLRKALKLKGVAVTGAVLLGTMKGNTAAAVPSSLLANLGKLALCGADHVTVPIAALPFTKTAMGASWMAKAFLTVAASVAIVLCVGLEARHMASRTATPEPRTQRSIQPEKSIDPARATPPSPATSPETLMKTEAALPLAQQGTTHSANTDSAVTPPPGTPEPPRRGVVQAAVSSSLHSLKDRAISTWNNLKDTLSGEGPRRRACQLQLVELGIVLKLFSEDSPGGYWPMLDARAGHLMFANNHSEMSPLYPTYFERASSWITQNGLKEFGTGVLDTRALICANDSLHTPSLQKAPLEMLDNSSYFYLGYAIRDMEGIEDFAVAYEAHVAAGLPFDSDLDTPHGKIHRLRKGVEQFFVGNPENPGEMAKILSQLPVLIEPPLHEGTGGNILYMDGHVAYMRYLQEQEFPMNARTMDILNSLRALKGTAPSR